MKIIEHGILNENWVSVDKIADWFYSSISSQINPIDKVTNELNLNNLLPKEIEFYNELLKPNELRRIITAKPDQFQTIINNYSKYEELFKNGKFKKYVILLGYHAFRSSDLAVELVRKLGIKVCPYCNQNYILVINKNKVDCEYDHFLPKFKYPYLSISFYNLIPSCLSCNRKKGTTFRKPFGNPYAIDFSSLFSYETNSKSVLDFAINGKKDTKSIKIALHEKSSNQNSERRIYKTHLDKFNLKECAGNHTDIAYEIYSKNLIYPESYRKQLYSDYSNVFKSDEIDRFILGNYTLPSEINQRPLSKLMQDINTEAIKSTQK